MSIFAILKAILSNTGATFKKDELAYLAVTSKIENPLRDKIAYALHVEYGAQFLVHREWSQGNRKKTDIAITDDDNRVKYMIEFKAHSLPTFEIDYSELIKNDLLKMYEGGSDDTEFFFVFFLNHVASSELLKQKFRHVIKYYPFLNAALKTHEFAIDITDKVKSYWERHLDVNGMDRGKTTLTIIPGGNYYDTPVSVFAFLYGPMTKTDLAKIVFGKNN